MKTACTTCLGLVLVLVLAPFALAQADQDGAAAERLFASAFSDGLDGAERVDRLEKVAKEHSSSAWADDALWLLGEAAYQQGRWRHAAHYWQYLMNRRPETHLEAFTQSLDIYRGSAIPETWRLLEVEGKAYTRSRESVREGEHIYARTRAVNAVAIVLWDRIGRCYESLDRAGLARAAYRKGIACTPEGSRWRKRFQDRIEQLPEPPRVAAPSEEDTRLTADVTDSQTSPPVAGEAMVPTTSEAVEQDAE
jgi:hypothetical protein